MSKTRTLLVTVSLDALGLVLLLTAGCASVRHEKPAPQPEPVATQPASPQPAAQPVAPPTQQPATAAVPVPAAASAPAVSAPAEAPTPAAVSAPSPTTPAPQTTGKAAPPVARTPAPIARAPTPPAPPVAATAPAAAPPPLDLTALEARLKETKAIGLFTKISLKNKVDDLLDQFREYHGGKAKVTVKELRQSYDLLMMKVLSLLQDDDPTLASTIVASREAIWILLADPKKFAALPT